MQERTTTPRPPKRILAEDPDEKGFVTPYGTFTLRRPSLEMQRRIHIEAARALEGLENVDRMGQLTNLMMTTLTVCAFADDQRFTDRPKGWPSEFTWGKAYEADFLTNLYTDFSEWVSSFRSPSGTDEGERGSPEASEVESVPAATGVQLGSKKR